MFKTTIAFRFWFYKQYSRQFNDIVIRVIKGYSLFLHSFVKSCFLNSCVGYVSHKLQQKRIRSGDPEKDLTLTSRTGLMQVRPMLFIPARSLSSLNNEFSGNRYGFWQILQPLLAWPSPKTTCFPYFSWICHVLSSSQRTWQGRE